MSHTERKDLLLGVSRGKTGELSGKSMIDREAFEDLHTQIKQTLIDIGERIYEGIADCEPLQYGKYDPCAYCAVKPICRKDNNNNTEKEEI